MKLKSLLFGSAAALATVSGAQAADLPVAAGPVDYVRVCDAAGTGFFYIPGTDVCLKVGGRVRAEYYVYDRDDDDVDVTTTSVIDPGTGRVVTTSVFNPRDELNEYSTRARGYINVDARADTDIGAIRAFVAYFITVGPEADPDDSYSEKPELDKAFITIGSDFGTLTAGHASSFFDFFGGNTYIAPGDPTQTLNLIALTAEFSGFAASVSFEDSQSGGRRPGVAYGGVFVDGGGLVLLNSDGSEFETLANDATGPQSWPDIVGHIRGDVGPFSAQIMGALHEVDGSEDDLGDTIGLGTLTGASVDETALGWAVGLGLSVGIPDTSFGVDMQAAYADGAPAYVYSWGGPVVDAVATDPNGDRVAESLETTTAWGVLGGLTGGFGMFIARLDASYGQIDHAGESADYTQWGIAADLAVQPAAGLEIGIGVGWTDIEFDNEVSAASAGNTDVGAERDELRGLLRVQYTF